MKLKNKIIPLGMVAIILVSILGYPLMLLEKMDKVITKVDTQELEQQVELKTDTQITLVDTPTISIESSPFKRIDTLVSSVQSLVEEGANYILFRDEYVFANTFIEKLIGKTVFIDAKYTVVKLENDYLAFLSEKVDTQEYAQNLIGLNDFLEKQGTPLLYVQAPYKISKYDNQLPAGVTDGNNEMADNLLAGIDGYVDYIDLREVMYESGMDQYDYFFKTDHHWLPETAFWAAGYIADTLNADYGFNMDTSYLDLDYYNVESYEDWFLGSQGKRVGAHMVGVDDISLISPTFETSFIFEVPSEGSYCIGSFEETLLDYSTIETKDYYNLSPYEVYLGGAFPLVKITNTMNLKGKKVLLVKDSFAKPMATFLALGCSQLDLIDLRYYKEGSLIEYLSGNEYDLVLFLYNPSLIRDEGFIFDVVVS